MKAEDIAQWVIDNRYPKNEKDKVSDHELYHGIIERIDKVKNLVKPDVSGNEALRVALLAFADHLNTYPKMEDVRFDFMVVDYLESKQ